MGERTETLREAAINGTDAVWHWCDNLSDASTEYEALREREPYKSHLELEACAEGWRLRLPNKHIADG